MVARSKPTEAQRASAERMLSDYAQSQWHGRVVVDHVDVGSEIQESDFPDSTWKAWEYQVYFRVKGTGAVFFSGIPKGTRQEDLWHYCPESRDLTSDDIKLLTAYSRETSTAAIGWGSDADWGFYADHYPGKDIWSVEPVALGKPWSSGAGIPDERWVFERLDDGNFRFIRAPVE